MPEAGRTCACTPGVLLKPAGGVVTLDPSQRVSSKQLEAKDREWRRLRHSQSSRPSVASTTALRRGESHASSSLPKSTLSGDVDAGGQEGDSGSSPSTGKAASPSLFGWLSRLRTPHRPAGG